jgi:hypothetical protein
MAMNPFSQQTQISKRLEFLISYALHIFICNSKEISCGSFKLHAHLHHLLIYNTVSSFDFIPFVSFKKSCCVLSGEIYYLKRFWFPLEDRNFDVRTRLELEQ